MFMKNIYKYNKTTVVSNKNVCIYVCKKRKMLEKKYMRMEIFENRCENKVCENRSTKCEWCKVQ